MDEQKQDLTRIEANILDLVVKGKDNKEIAEQMYVSSHTIKAHISVILKKLNANNRTHATYIAMKSRIIH